jgi:hypothetical protein
MTTIQRYPDDLLDMLTPEGFERQYWALYASSDWKSREECYEVLEARHEHYFGLRKYSEYNNFRNMIARRHKQRIHPRNTARINATK